MIPADSAIVDNDVPSPESDCVPLLDFKLLLALACGRVCVPRFGDLGAGGGFCGGSWTSIGHVNIGHCEGVRER